MFFLHESQTHGVSAGGQQGRVISGDSCEICERIAGHIVLQPTSGSQIRARSCELQWTVQAVMMVNAYCRVKTVKIFISSMLAPRHGEYKNNVAHMRSTQRWLWKTSWDILRQRHVFVWQIAAKVWNSSTGLEMIWSCAFQFLECWEHPVTGLWNGITSAGGPQISFSTVQRQQHQHISEPEHFITWVSYLISLSFLQSIRAFSKLSSSPMLNILTHTMEIFCNIKNISFTLDVSLFNAAVCNFFVKI